MAAVVLIGTLDTKGEEYAFVQSLIKARSGMIAVQRTGNDRGRAVAVMAKRTAKTARELCRQGRLDAHMKKDARK